MGIGKSVTVVECHYQMIFSARRSFFGPKKIVTVTTVTITEVLCNIISIPKLGQKC